MPAPLILNYSSLEIAVSTFLRLQVMPSNAIGPLILLVAILLTTAHLLGYLFAKLRQPRVIGEILAGIILGPFALGKSALYSQLLQLNTAAPTKKAALVLS